jgi:hypothetical protein
MAVELGVHEALNMKASYNDLTDKEKIPVDHVRFVQGGADPIRESPATLARKHRQQENTV